MTPNQIYMLAEIADVERRVPDVAMMINFGPQWRRTALALEKLGYIDANRTGWMATALGAEKAKDVR